MHNVENELVHQKDAIRELINRESYEKYEEAIALINFSEELWAACGYAYKTQELRQLIKDAVVRELNYAKNWKQQAKWQKLLPKVTSGQCGACGKERMLHKVKYADDTSIGSMLICEECDNT